MSKSSSPLDDIKVARAIGAGATIGAVAAFLVGGEVAFQIWGGGDRRTDVSGSVVGAAAAFVGLFAGGLLGWLIGRILTKIR